MRRSDKNKGDSDRDRSSRRLYRRPPRTNPASKGTIMSLPLQSGSGVIDAAHSSVEFTVGHLGITKLRGRFGTVDASAQVGDSLATTSLSATIDLSSIDTGNSDRDGHLRT